MMNYDKICSASMVDVFVNLDTALANLIEKTCQKANSVSLVIGWISIGIASLSRVENHVPIPSET